MRISKGLRPSLSLVALSCVALCAACGGSSKPSASAVSVCVERHESSAQYAVIARAFDAGRLGTPAQVREDLMHLGSTPFKPTRFLRTDGTLPGWSALSSVQRQTLSVWADRTPRVANVLGNDPSVAALDAKQKWTGPCGSDPSA